MRRKPLMPRELALSKAMVQAHGRRPIMFAPARSPGWATRFLHRKSKARVSLAAISMPVIGEGER